MSYRLTKWLDIPFCLQYCPELDVSPVLGPSEAPYYQFLIGVMRWMVTIRCIKINTKISLLSLYLVMPREGHLEAALHFICYLKLKYNL